MIVHNVSRLDEPRLTRNGSSVLASFDVSIENITIHGCAAVRTPHGTLAVWSPYAGGGRAVTFSRTLAKDILKVVRPALGEYVDAA